MKELRLSNINLQAPYQVKQNPHASNSYVFKTDSGLEFIISLQENVEWAKGEVFHKDRRGQNVWSYLTSQSGRAVVARLELSIWFEWSVCADGDDGIAIVEGCLDVLAAFLYLTEWDVIA